MTHRPSMSCTGSEPRRASIDQRSPEYEAFSRKPDSCTYTRRPVVKITGEPTTAGTVTERMGVMSAVRSIGSERLKP
ncbi:MAG: hypothetical protein DYG93_06785 [Leptolyngbya sp. PLA2]|nr:hypothetical protein [Leptolyngbya sp. PL-A2]